MSTVQSQRARRDILVALLRAADDPALLLATCAAAVEGREAEAVADALGVRIWEAQAVLDMQVRRFTPHAVARMRAELADTEEWLRRLP